MSDRLKRLADEPLPLPERGASRLASLVPRMGQGRRADGLRSGEAVTPDSRLLALLDVFTARSPLRTGDYAAPFRGMIPSTDPKAPIQDRLRPSPETVDTVTGFAGPFALAGTVGKVAPTTYFRRTRTPTPDTGVGYMMFADDAERIRPYGPNLWKATAEGAPQADDLVEDAAAAFRGSPDFMEQYPDATPEDLAALIAPRDIVDSAGAWDDPAIVEFLWNELFEPRGITAVRTRNGMVTFDPSIVRRGQE